MKKLIILSLVTIMSCMTFVVKAQDYNTALGISLGGNMGVTFKQFVSHASAIEAGVDYTFRHEAVNFFAVYQYHLPLADSFNAYLGAGFNVGGEGHHNNNNSAFMFGLDPNVGLEYKFDAPVTIGVDYRPSINIVGHTLVTNVSVKVRYTF